MDPLIATGLVGNIVQFVDFTSKLLAKSNEAYRSAEGALAKNTDLEAITTDLIKLSRLETSNPALASSNQALGELWTQCEAVGKELLEALAKLKVQEIKTKWKSFRKELKSVWSKQEVTREINEADQTATREEIANLKAAINELSQQIKQRDAELGQFLKEFRETKSEKKRKFLQERSNAASAALLALEMIYKSLQALLVNIQVRTVKALKPLKESYNWRVFSYSSQRFQSNKSELKEDSNHGFTRAQHGNIVAVLVYDDNAHCNAAVDLYHSSYFFQPLHTVRSRLTMALLVSAIDAWDPDSAFENIGRVFQVTEERQKAHGTFLDEGLRGKELSCDINFWKLHAKGRGIDVAMIHRFQESRILSSFSRNEANRSLLVDFMIWILESLLKKTDISICQRTESHMHGRVAVFVSHLVLEFAFLLQDFGLNIAIHRDNTPYPGADDTNVISIVVLRPSLAAETSTEPVTWNDHWSLDDDYISQE